MPRAFVISTTSLPRSASLVCHPKNKPFGFCRILLPSYWQSLWVSSSSQTRAGSKRTVPQPVLWACVVHFGDGNVGDLGHGVLAPGKPQGQQASPRCNFVGSHGSAAKGLSVGRIGGLLLRIPVFPQELECKDPLPTIAIRKGCFSDTRALLQDVDSNFGNLG